MTLLTVGGVPAAQEPEAISLLGTPLHRVEADDSSLAEMQQQLRAARAELAARPGDVEALIWVGRRTAYLGLYRDAIDIFSRGLERHPSDPRLLRHRGHRYISTRQLQKAVTDLERAADLIAGQPNPVEPDGQPNRLNLPRGTLHFNIYYHLGLSHYLLGNYPAARRAYERCLQVSDNDDVLVATAYWSVLTHWKLGETEAAAGVLDRIAPQMDVIENDSYHRLLLLFQDVLEVDSLESGGDALQGATQGYGVAAWHLRNGRRAEGLALCRRVLESPRWSAFGYIACEAEVARGR